MLENNASKSHAKRKYKKEVVLSSYAVLAPQIIGFFVFTIYPIIWVLRYSVFDYDGVTATFTGIENYIRIFTRDASFWKSVLNTFIISYGKLIIELPLALIAAVIISSSKFKLKRLFSVGFYMPNVISVSVTAMIFVFMFSTFGGAVNTVLQKLRIISAPIDWFANKWSAMLVIMAESIWKGFGINMLFFMSGIQNVPADIYEAAEIDGANKFIQFIKITVPMIAPVLRVIIMLAMVNGIKMMNNVLLLTNGGPNGETNVAMLYLYKMFFQTADKPQYGYASAMGVVISIIIALITVVYLRFTKEANEVY